MVSVRLPDWHLSLQPEITFKKIGASETFVVVISNRARRNWYCLFSTLGFRLLSNII